MRGKRTRTVTIGGGTLRGRVLRYPDDRSVRPTMQRAKQSLFASLGSLIEGAVFADLYAGAGAVGIEAVSRGAAFVHWVENDNAALDALRANLQACRIESTRCRVHAADVRGILDARPCPIGEADLAFADPPYGAHVVADLVRRVSVEAMPRLKVLVVEHRAKTPIEPPPGMALERARPLGETRLSFFVRA